jgi:dolichyl-phosphate-mannose-protein mannosyltransferase
MSTGKIAGARNPRPVSRAATMRILAFLLLAPLLACSTASAKDLITNGLFTKGIAEQPAGWKHIAFDQRPDAVTFQWIRESSETGMIAITNLKPDDSRWYQIFPVTPSTWYRVSGWIRTQNVGARQFGASLTEFESGYASRDVRGTAPWQEISFFMKTRPAQKSAQLGCRLGGFSSEDTGTAYFTGISFSEVGSPPRSAKYVYGATFWDMRAGAQVELAGAFMALLIVWLLWRYISADSAVPRG